VIAAEIMATAFVLDGKYAASFPFFGQERRGAPVAAFVRFGLEPVREKTRVYNPDIVIVLDRVQAGNPICYAGLKEGGMAIINSRHEEIVPLSVTNLELLATADATGISLQEIGLPITNSCMLGAFAKATQLVQLDTLIYAIEEFLKGDMLVRNKRALQRGFHEVAIKRQEKDRVFNDEITNPTPNDNFSAAVPFQSPYESAWAEVQKLVTVRTGEWRFIAPVLDKKTCRQCGWCSLYCPLGCMKPGEDGYFYPDLNYCKGCGICAYECPAQAIRMVMEEVGGY